MRVLRLAVVAALGAVVQGCTLFVAGPKATSDGSAIAAQTNDCSECDWRFTVVPSKSGDEVPKRKPIMPYRQAYPRYVGDDRGDLFRLENVDLTIFPNWTYTQPVGYIDNNVERTFKYLDGSYPMINEHQVGFAESTCGARLINKPAFVEGGHAMFDVVALMQVAMERATTAREAIQLMGDLATTYGYYGSVWEGSEAHGEAGEALGVVDRTEAWLFHVAPDHTGRGAVWVAQRVRDYEFAAVANGFTIRRVDLRDPDHFMGSSNMETVAREAGLWKPEIGTLKDGNFDWSGAFADHPEQLPGEVIKRMPGVTRRVWRLYHFVAPSVELPADTDYLGSDYPTAIVVDKPIQMQDFFHFMRDHFEGTPYDLTKGMAAGWMGSPLRFDGGPDFSYTGLPWEQWRKGEFERAISIARATYTFVVRANGALPDEVGAMAWVGMYAPHHSVYVPMYPWADSTPDAMSRGTYYKLDKGSNYWAMSAAGNYATGSYRESIREFVKLQSELETKFETEQRRIEAEALRLRGGSDSLSKSARKEIVRELQDFQNAASATTLERMWGLLDYLIVHYKDGNVLAPFQEHTSRFWNFMPFYPNWWLEQVGFFYDHPLPSPALATVPGIAPAAVSGYAVAAGEQGRPAGVLGGSGSMLLVGVVCGVMGVALGKRMAAKETYSSLA